MQDPSNFDPDYDPDKNSRESWRLAIKQARLNKLKRGETTPRYGHPEEFDAWQAGRRARMAIGAVIGTVLSGLVVAAYVESGSRQHDGTAVYGYEGRK